MSVSVLELLQKLVPLIWPPRFHRLRFHSVFAPNAKWRRAVVPEPPDEERCEHAQKASSSRRKSRAELLARVFAIDVLECPNCASRMQRIAFITTADAIAKLLDAVGHPADMARRRRRGQVGVHT